MVKNSMLRKDRLDAGFPVVLLRGIIKAIEGIIPIIGNWLGGLYSQFIITNLTGQATSLEDRPGLQVVQ